MENSLLKSIVGFLIKFLLNLTIPKLDFESNFKVKLYVRHSMV